MKTLRNIHLIIYVLKELPLISGGGVHEWSNRCDVKLLEFGEKNYVNEYLPYSGHSLVVFNKVYRRRILNQYSIRFDTSLKFGEDVFFNLIYMQYANGKLLEDFRAIYLQHKTEGSLTTTKEFDFFIKNTKCMDCLEKSHPDWYSEIKQFVYWHYINSADLAVWRIISGRDSRYNENADELRSIKNNIKLREAVEQFNFSKTEYLHYKVNLIINGKFITYKLRYLILPQMAKKIRQHIRNIK